MSADVRQRPNAMGSDHDNRHEDVPGQQDRRIILGRVSGLHGVKGWVKVFSYTSPREGITGYRKWQVKRGNEWVAMDVKGGRPQGKTVVAKLAGIDARDAAAMLIDAEIAVWRSQLPPPAADEFYWIDLEGLSVQTIEGVVLGRISHLVETGSNDVMVVKGDRERLVPFIRDQVVKRVDFDAGLVEVDWDPDF